MISSGLNLVMTVIGFSVSTMFIVFICTRLICARIRLNASRRSFPLSSRSNLSMMERGLHGLEPVIVANFPTKKYSELCFSSKEDAQCIVCLADYREEDILRILPYCAHSFHASCIDRWLQHHSTCPVCRISLRDFNENKGMLLRPVYCSTIQSRYELDSIPSSFHDHDCPLRNHHHHHRRMDPIQEDQCPTEDHGTEARDRISASIESCRPSKHVGDHKLSESPSSQ